MKEITEFKYIPISSIVLNSRNDDSDLNVDEIIDEIKDKGLIRPLIVSNVDNKFILKLGTRRFLAFKKLNYNNIFCGIINGEADLDEIMAIALCYTELDGMLSFKDKAQALNYLLKNNNGEISKVSSKTNISSEEIITIMNYRELLEQIKKNISGISRLDKDLLIKKSSQLEPNDLKSLNNLLEKLI